MIVNIPINLFSLAGIAIIFIYFATHMGSREHAGWFGSAQMFLVIALAIVLFCIGYDGPGIWHMLTGFAGGH
jgi:heme/copper-type cytochrome/quinol oxidase subunit 4